MHIAKQQETHLPHHLNNHGGHFGCRLQSTTETVIGFTLVYYFLVDYVFSTFLDCQLVAQIAKFIQTGPTCASQQYKWQSWPNNGQILPEKIMGVGVESQLVNYVSIFFTMFLKFLLAPIVIASSLQR